MRPEPTADHGGNVVVLRDARGYRRSKATMPGYHAGRTPRNKGRRYPATALTPEDIAALLEKCPNDLAGRRMYAAIVVLVATGMRIGELLALDEGDLNHERKSIRIRNGKGSKPRTVGMNDWGWAGLHAWLHLREQLAPGPVFCIVQGPTAGCAWDASCVRRNFRRLARRAGLRKHVHPHACRHAFTVWSMRAGAQLHLLQRQLGHASLDATMKYFASIDEDTVVDHFASLPAPVVRIPSRPVAMYLPPQHFEAVAAALAA